MSDYAELKCIKTSKFNPLCTAGQLYLTKFTANLVKQFTCAVTRLHHFIFLSRQLDK